MATAVVMRRRTTASCLFIPDKECPFSINRVKGPDNPSTCSTDCSKTPEEEIAIRAAIQNLGSLARSLGLMIYEAQLELPLWNNPLT